MKSKGYMKKLVAPIVISVLLTGMFITLLHRINNSLDPVESDLKNKRAAVLNPDCNKKVLSEIIFNNGYAETKKDADFIADILADRQNENGRLSSLYSLQKRKHGQVRMSLADSANVMNSQREASIKRLGQDKEVFAFSKDSLAPGGKGRIVVKVFSREEPHSRLKKMLKIDDKLPCPGVPVRLTTHFRDSSNKAESVPIGYTKTDSTGVAVFEGLDMSESYSVLPIKSGFEYGTSKGTKEGKWEAKKLFLTKATDCLEYSFEEKEHRIPLFSNATLRQIKNDKTILVRSPQEFKADVVKWFVLVMIAWWVLCLYLIIRNRKFNGALLASCMFLSCLCVLMMFSMQDPLNDEMNGAVMGQGVIIGLFVCFLLQGIDFIKFYQNQTKTGFDIPLNVFKWIFKPYRQKVAGLARTLKNDDAGVLTKMLAVLLVIISLPLLLLDLLQITRLSKAIDSFCEKLPKGIGWLVLALILTLMLWTPLGQSIGGMKVNLNLLGLKFQPSEIAKYLILLFMAAFFTQRADTIIAYSRPNRMDMLGRKISTLISVIIGLAILMAMYILLGDMGPGLVIGITFILLYSLIKSKVNLDNLSDEDKWKSIFKCDFAMLIYGILSFVAFLLVADWLDDMFHIDKINMPLICGCLWFIFWVGYFGLKKQLYESAMLMNEVIFIFIFMGQIFDNIVLFCLLRLIFWGLLAYILYKEKEQHKIYSKKQQNLIKLGSVIVCVPFVLLFLFSGRLQNGITLIKNSDTINRFEERRRMCVNTWGDSDIENLGSNAEPVFKPVFNTQVANGLWALASGGMQGQGFGEGKPSLVPAFHTDMILSSIGEQLGWIGLLLVVIALAVLLRRMSVIGYRVGHPFAFYLCLGFAIVLGVQFFIIALGSSGMIPLTGVTVPFLSYGRVSMILNLAAFGVVLSLCNNIKEAEESAPVNVGKSTVKQYSYPIAMVSAVFVFMAVITLSVWQYYQFWRRDSTLIHPAYVINTQGAPVVEYNPRINLLVNNMYAGRIYDRNGKLLATSDKSEIKKEDYVALGISEDDLNNMLKRNLKRYYPMGAHMFFMVGDQNEGLMFSYNENSPAGYMAEAQHLSYLRGFDNVLYDQAGKPIKVNLKTDRLQESSYLPPKDTVSGAIQLRDYSSLLKYLKDGIDGKKVAKHNEQVKDEKYDLHLTVDAALQVDLQNRLATYMQEKHKNNSHFNRMRVSAVVLDAENGDLLASANYPLPDYNRLSEEEDLARINGKLYATYSDNEKGNNWKAYTDRDLGTTFQTAPGSTAKVMSAIGGFRKMGGTVSTKTYYITPANRIELGNFPEPSGNVSMHDAIVKSSNCYFVNLVNDKDLYSELETVYSSVGVNIGGIVPYYYSRRDSTQWKEHDYHKKINSNRSVAISKYELFKQGKLLNPKKDRNGTRRVKTRNETNMSVPEWKWAWGQGYSNENNGKTESFDILASPLNMARIASSVINKGHMHETQYLMGFNKYEKSQRTEADFQLMKPNEAQILKEYMLAEAANQRKRQRDKSGRVTVTLPAYVGGKTGTPERSRILSKSIKTNPSTGKNSVKYVLENEGKTNDGWYMFFVEGDESHHPIAVAVRMERGVGSGSAVRLTGNMLLECLNRHGYTRNR